MGIWRRIQSLGVRQRLYGGALLVALLGLAVNAAFFGGPTRAHAGPAGLHTAGASGNVARSERVATAAVTNADASDGELAPRLRAFAAGLPVDAGRDALRPARGWLPGVDPGGDPNHASAADWVAHHRLEVVLLPRSSGVSGRPAVPAAVIGGRLIRVGQFVDGWQLVSVSAGTARLTNGPAEVEVHLR